MVIVTFELKSSRDFLKVNDHWELTQEWLYNCYNHYLLVETIYYLSRSQERSQNCSMKLVSSVWTHTKRDFHQELEELFSSTDCLYEPQFREGPCTVDFRCGSSAKDCKYIHSYHHSPCNLCTYKKRNKSWCILVYIVTLCTYYRILAFLYTISRIYLLFSICIFLIYL